MVGPQQQFWYECSQCDFKNKNLCNFEYHLKCHTRNQRIKCHLCSFTSNFQFHADRHLKFHHLDTENALREIKSEYEDAATAKETDQNKNNEIELMDTYDNDHEPEKTSIISFDTATEATKSDIKNTSIELEAQKIELEEADCRKRISQCREDIRMARTSMAERRGKVNKHKEMRSEKKKQQDFLSRCLALMRINNEKLSNLSIESKKLEILRTRIRETNKTKLETELQLRALQLDDLKSKLSLYYEQTNSDEVIVPESNSNEAGIKNVKIRIKALKTQLESMREEARDLEKDVELLKQSLHVVVEVPDQVLQGFQSEIEELENGINESLRDDNEDAFNQLIISTEEKTRNLVELKNNLFDIMFMKKSIRRMSGFK